MGGWFLFIAQLGGGSSVSPNVASAVFGGRVRRNRQLFRHLGRAEFDLIADFWIRFIAILKSHPEAAKLGPNVFLHPAFVELAGEFHKYAFRFSKLNSNGTRGIVKSDEEFASDLATLIAATPAERQYDELMAMVLISFALNHDN